MRGMLVLLWPVYTLSTLGAPSRAATSIVVHSALGAAAKLPHQSTFWAVSIAAIHICNLALSAAGLVDLPHLRPHWLREVPFQACCGTLERDTALLRPGPGDTEGQATALLPG